MRKLFVPLAIVAAAMFAYAPVGIARVPYESTMLLVQKIFYFHFATWMAVTASVAVCGVASAIYLFKGTAVADHYAVASAELTTVFCTFGLVSGSLWGRKAWGVWWQWDARLTMAFMLEMVFLGYLLVRKYGGRLGETCRGHGHLRRGDGAVHLQIGGLVAHGSSADDRDEDAGRQVSCRVEPRLVLHAAFLVLFVVMLAARVQLEYLRAELDRSYLAAEE